MIYFTHELLMSPSETTLAFIRQLAYSYNYKRAQKNNHGIIECH